MAPPPIWVSLVAQMVKNLPATQEPRVGSLGGEDVWRAWHPTPVFLPGESSGQRSLEEPARLIYHVANISLFWYNFVCVLTKRDMKLKIGQKAFHFSFVDLCG